MSVSLPQDDIVFLDAYAESAGMTSYAIRRLRQSRSDSIALRGIGERHGVLPKRLLRDLEDALRLHLVL